MARSPLCGNKEQNLDFSQAFFLSPERKNQSRSEIKKSRLGQRQKDFAENNRNAEAKENGNVPICTKAVEAAKEKLR